MIVSLADFFLRHQKLVSAGKQINAEVYQEFLRQLEVPWVKRTYPGGKYVFEADLLPVHTARTNQQLFPEFWTLVD
jgi:hypothetical protein